MDTDFRANRMYLALRLFSAHSGLRGHSVFRVLVLPRSSILYLSPSPPSQRIDVRPAILFPFLNQTLVDERIQIRVEPTVMDLRLVVVLQLHFDREAVRLVKTTPPGVARCYSR